jgi:hypothetical protein
MVDIDVLSIIVILFDALGVAFLVWRVSNKTATLWGTARFVYLWVATLTFYHGIIYTRSMFVDRPNALITGMLHPLVMLYMLNPLLIAIIHWRGGRLWK